MNNHEIWQAVLAELELSISKANFVTWFKNTGIISIHEGTILLCVPSAFTKSWIENKYHRLIIQSLERVTEKPIKKLEYRIENIKNVNTTTQPIPPSLSSELETSPPSTPPEYNTFAPPNNTVVNNNSSGSFILNPKYSFESFVVGKGSELAYAAAQAVVARPGAA